MNKRKNVYEITRVALCATLLCLSSYLVVPLPFTPVVLSFHTVAVHLIGLLLTPKQAGMTVVVYLLMGLVGLPVFSGGTAGASKLFGPTGGYYFGFLIAAVGIALLRGTKNSFGRYFWVTITVGMVVEHFAAVLGMSLYNGGDIRLAFLTVSLPFLPGDLIKCALSSLIAVPLKRSLQNANH